MTEQRDELIVEINELCRVIPQNLLHFELEDLHDLLDMLHNIISYQVKVETVVFYKKAFGKEIIKYYNSLETENEA